MATDRTERFLQKAVDAKFKYVYRYYVTGKGVFPFDMLRYDLAHPVTSGDALALIANFTDPGAHLKTRSILLSSFNQPTLARWASFGWSVGTVKISD